MKNVFVMTARQEDQVGLRPRLALVRHPRVHRATCATGSRSSPCDDVNAAVKRHLSGKDLSFVIVAKDAKALADALVADGASTVKYDAEKPAELLEEDRAIGAMKLGIRARGGAGDARGGRCSSAGDRRPTSRMGGRAQRDAHRQRRSPS